MRKQKLLFCVLGCILGLILVSLSHKGAYRILCLGDGITEGGYPSSLEKILNQGSAVIRFKVIDKGKSGLNTRSILSNVESYINEYHPDMVVAMMGITDENLEIHISYKKSTSTKQPYLEKGDAKKNEALLTKAIELDPANDDAYAKLGWTYGNQGKFSQAEKFLKKAIELNPKNAEAYIGLGWVHKAQGHPQQAEEFIRQAIELNPQNDDAYFRLGWLYIDQDKLLQAEEFFKKTLDYNPKHAYAYIRLGGLYMDQGKYIQAEKVVKQAILECDPNQKARFYGALGSIYEGMGNIPLSKEYYDKANQTRLNEYLPLVSANYLKLKGILHKRNIKLVCVQYPLRSIEPLKEIFKDDAEGIIFVDNESIFKGAVREHGYKQYFRDMFGGDFGHCTPEGNRLLAENIAREIDKKVRLHY